MSGPVPRTRSEEIALRLAELVPGGGHTYSKGADQFACFAPAVLERAEGAYCWDADGNRYLDWGMGNRVAILGHRHPEVEAAVQREMERGVNFTRPSVAEWELAEFLIDLLPCAEMVKFGKNGSDVTTAAVRLARAFTGRDEIGICAEHPFFSTHDWFISTTPISAGVPVGESERVRLFHYNDLASVERLFEERRGRIACLVLEPVRDVAPTDHFLSRLVEIAHREGALVLFDEMISGVRFDVRGAHVRFGAAPDLATYGKAISNGYSFSLLAGRRDVMRLGGGGHDRRRVFLLSQTHGSESTGLAAARATLEVCLREKVPEHLERVGALLRDGVNQAARDAGIERWVRMTGFGCSPFLTVAREDGSPWFALLTLLQEELTLRGILAPWWSPSLAHGEDQVESTLQAFRVAAGAAAEAISAGAVDSRLRGPVIQPVFRRYPHCLSSRCGALGEGPRLPCCEGFVP